VQLESKGAKSQRKWNSGDGGGASDASSSSCRGVVVVVVAIVIAPAIPGYFGPEIRNKASTFSARKIRRTATGAAAALNVQLLRHCERPNVASLIASQAVANQLPRLILLLERKRSIAQRCPLSLRPQVGRDR
jgi:hypothetical protein